MVKHEEWGKWQEESVNYSCRTALFILLLSLPDSKKCLTKALDAFILRLT
ncbi:DUF3102 domain-containing protein [Desulfitobacterium sp. PCE1]|nr:DUF3102 domain-containing protein [Desulfitobacterium sp. PCE1]